MRKREAWSVILQKAKIKAPKRLTLAGVTFITEELRLASLIGFLREADLFFARHSDLWYEDLEKDERSSEFTAALLQVMSERFRRLPSSLTHEPIIAEMLVCRIADNYLLYLKELLKEIFLTRPETLRSGQMERLDFVLQFLSMDRLISAIAEKKVQEVMFKGTRELISFFNELGVTLFPNSADVEPAVRVIETRHLIVHNLGVVNETFKARVPKAPESLGDRVRADYEMAKEYDIFLIAAVFAADKIASKKFGLRQFPPQESRRRPISQDDGNP